MNFGCTTLPNSHIVVSFSNYIHPYPLSHIATNYACVYYTGNLRSSTMPCWPRPGSTTTRATTTSSALPAGSTSGTYTVPIIQIFVAFFVKQIIVNFCTGRYFVGINNLGRNLVISNTRYFTTKLGSGSCKRR